MPTRTPTTEKGEFAFEMNPKEKAPPKRTAGKKNETLVDLNFLPTEYLDAINNMFDGYFSLGMRSSNWHEVAEETPHFPNKMASLTSMDLGNLLGSYTAWYSFASDKLKYIAVAHNYIEQELGKALDSELGKLVSDKGNIETKKSKAKSSASYLMVYSYIQKLRGMKTTLEMELGNYDKCIATLSREVSRREHNGGY